MTTHFPHGIRTYRGRTDGRYRTGKPVRLFVRAGRWWLHIEVGSRSFGLCWWGR